MSFMVNTLACVRPENIFFILDNDETGTKMLPVSIKKLYKYGFKNVHGMLANTKHSDLSTIKDCGEYFMYPSKANLFVKILRSKIMELYSGVDINNV